MFDKFIALFKPTEAERREAQQLAGQARNLEHGHSHRHADGIVHFHDHTHNDHEHEHEHVRGRDHEAGR